MRLDNKNKLAAVQRPLVLALHLSIILLIVSFMFSSTASAGGGVPITRNFASNGDAVVTEQNKNKNYGSDSEMSVTKPSNKENQSYVKFDISSIPAVSIVSLSTLTLYATSVPSSSRTYNAHKVASTDPWDESTIKWQGRPNVVGGSAITSITPLIAGSMIWTVTSHVQDFVSGTTNNGWRISESAASSSEITRFQTKDGTPDAYDPKLSVTFTATSWDSYQNSGRTIISDSFIRPATVYMKGTGFKNGNYNVGYYSSTGNKIAIENNIIVTTGSLQSSQELSVNAATGVWHALTQPASGYSSLPDTYSTAAGAPDTYGLIADDTFSVVDTTPPASVTDLHNTTFAPTSITWTWTDPSDPDFSKVKIYIDGVFKGEVLKGVQSYTADSLNPDTEYTIGTQTVDTAGNINTATVTNTARTSPLPFGVHIQILGTPVVGESTSAKLKVEYTNFNSGDDYNISVFRVSDGAEVYTDSGNTLSGANPETIPINWIPSTTGSHTIVARGKGTIASTSFDVYDSAVISPIPELGTVILTSAGLFGIFLVSRKYKAK